MKLKVLTVGFEYGTIKPRPSIDFWVISEYTQPDEALSGREQLALLKKLATTCDLALLNTDKKLEPYEVVLLHTVYSNLTPVLGVGLPNKDRIISEFVANQFTDLDTAVAFLENFYA
jgi:hypothetical protein